MHVNVTRRITVPAHGCVLAVNSVLGVGRVGRCRRRLEDAKGAGSHRWENPGYLSRDRHWKCSLEADAHVSQCPSPLQFAVHPQRLQLLANRGVSPFLVRLCVLDGVISVFIFTFDSYYFLHGGFSPSRATDPSSRTSNLRNFTPSTGRYVTIPHPG